MKTSTIDILIIVGYLVACLTIGLLKFKKIKSISDYSLGEKLYSQTVILSTIFATSVSAYSTIGSIEKIYSMGFIFVLSFITKPLFFLFTGKILSKNKARFVNCFSISDIISTLYGDNRS